MDYYKLQFDDQEIGSWELVVPWDLPGGNWRDVWAYNRCEYISQPEEISIKISDKGLATDFNLANFNIPIVSKRLGDALEEVAANQIQRIPVSVGDDSDWEILNIVNLVECLDHGRSVIDYYPEDTRDSVIVEAPERARKPRGVRLLRIKASKADGFHIFRISDWPVPIIVSSKVRDALQDTNLTGFTFRCVT